MSALHDQHDFLVGLSVDGPRELHDRYRVDRRKQGTFDLVMAGLAHLRRHAVDFNILCTVNAANEKHGRAVYRFFRDELGAFQGSAFSCAPTLLQSAWFRPHNRDPHIPGLYLVGAGTHPGAGVPGVVNSAKATASLILEDFRA